MSDTIATTRRVVLQFAEHHVDVLVPAHLRLSDALRSVGVDPGDPGVVVVASDGTPVDTSRSAVDVLEDGTVLHISARPPRGRAGSPPAPVAPGADGSGDGIGDAVRATALLPQIVLMVLAGVCALFVMTTSVFGSLATDDILSSTQQAIVATAFLGAGLGLALRPRVFQDGRNEMCLVIAAFLACAGGASAIDAALAQSHQLALATGLLCAGAVSAVGAVSTRRAGGDGLQMALVLAVVFGWCAVLALGALFLVLPAWAFAALALGCVPPALRALPSWSLQVPDTYLVDAEHVTRAALSVRGARPQPTPPLRNAVVLAAVRRGDRLLGSGIVTQAVVAAIATPVVLFGAAPTGLAHTAALILVVAVAVALVCIPRNARNVTSKTVPRAAAGAMLLTLVVRVVLDGQANLVGLAVAAIVVGLGLGFLAIPVARGHRSVAFSRLIDAVEGLAVMLALPAALASIGAIELVRSAFSR
ncbi:hypothetical protein SAMN05216410_2819 [Sanguibacter gelidistatuariae]|uniref:Type VII secretion integral membrane protein EccD n=1 Tax=Sanguibacter gelidistatuariae TaxID=1814289 RepID=A0A1G6S0S7_9MICO|nr:hypothetical protein [Sanguibacter gelidistatuariae]SDD09795.1 hypothetical protein SAMN05216410_2819 [Sanguibacter gelidistatuariae]